MLSFVAGSSESQISVDQVTLYSSNVKGILRYMLGGEGVEHACTEAKIFSVKKTTYNISLHSIYCVFH